MRLFTEILKKFNTREVELEETKELSQEKIEEKAPFVENISLYEFQNADWEDFGRKLKQNRILPNSYPKEPSNIDIRLSKKGEPMVLLTFNSSTSNSVRKYMLLQDGAFEYINGAVDDGKNQELIYVWNNFKEEIRYINWLNTNREGGFMEREAAKMIEKAQKMKSYKDAYELERDFLEKHKDKQFEDLGSVYLGGADFEEVPCFVPLEVNSEIRKNKVVVPFSPRTLEFCILHMTNDAKIEYGEYIDDFEKACRKIKKHSCYESEDWDTVIKIGMDILKRHYQAYILENGF